jgi:hypothetical protein
MDGAELEWIAWTTPITTSLGAALAASDFSGRTVACRQHILADIICILAPLVEAGARVRLAPCNPYSTDDRTVAHLASIGVEVRAHAGMSAGELDESLAWQGRPWWGDPRCRGQRQRRRLIGDDIDLEVAATCPQDRSTTAFTRCSRAENSWSPGRSVAA